MKEKPIMRIGMVGCGGIAHAHAQAIADSRHMQITACADIALEKARQYADTFGVRQSFGSMEELLAEADVDLVLLATFPANHLQEIRGAVDAGAKNILCEKSLAMNGSEGDTIMQLARETGTFIREGLTYRHHPQIQRAKQIIESGEIGRVSSVQAHFSDFQGDGPPDPENWRNRIELGGGTLAAKGCYLIDACLLFAGAAPREVICHTTYHPSGPCDIAQSAMIVFEDGGVGQIESSHRAAWRHHVRVHGTEGWLDIPFAVVTKDKERFIEVSRGTSWSNDAGEVRREQFAQANSYRLQLENVYATLMEGAPFPMPLEDSVKDLHVTTALLESARLRQWVGVQ